MRQNRVIAAAVCALLVVACVAGVALSRVGTGATQTAARHSSPTPPAKFTATPTAGAVPLTVRFTATSMGMPKAWMWTFGDGTTVQGQNPVHVYTATGTYTVSLVVTSADGASTVTKTEYITVNGPAPRVGWTTIIDDQFNTPGLPAHWVPYSGSYAGDASSCTAPSQVQVPGDGYLHLKMQFLTSGICGRAWYTGGVQITRAYGGTDQAITVRWRVVPAADPGAVRSTRIIPMRWVDDPNYAWYQGEADYCEGSALGGCYAYLHYGRYSQIEHGYAVDLTQWHTFRIEQRDHQVSLFIDDMTKPVWVYKGNARTVPGAFMRTVLQQSCSLTAGCPSAAYAGDVEDIQIDWITIENATSVSGDAQTQSGPTTHTGTAASAVLVVGRASSADVNDAGIGALMTATPLDSRSVSTAEQRRRARA